MSRQIALASDHAGYELKQHLISYLREKNVEVLDLGAHSTDSVDYPDFASELSKKVAAGSPPTGILICGTGIGMAMRANRYHRVRAANCNNLFSARLSREHNDANVLTIGSRVIAPTLAEEIVDLFLATPYMGGRHQGRLDKLDAPCPV